jgi:drug/metabolite transporter (DMT)-like permease
LATDPRFARSGSTEPPAPGVLLLVFTPLVALANGVLALASGPQELRSGGDPVELVGYVFAYAFLIPVLVALLFQLGRRFRNPRAMLRVFLWTSLMGMVVSLLAKVGL